MTRIPRGWTAKRQEIYRLAASIDGWLTRREIDFLSLLAIYRSARGVILEVGAHHGKSTVVLAKASSAVDSTPVLTIDPAAGHRLRSNLQTAQVDDIVQVFAEKSQDVLPNWRLPLGLFWHDGSNVEEIVTEDVRAVRPYLQDGAIVAFHDVLNTTGHRIKVFVNEVLASDHFGPVGACGSIGWAQFRMDPRQAAPFAAQRGRLKQKLQRLIPFHAVRYRDLTRRQRMRYKALRSRVAHRSVNPRHWLRQVA